MAEYIRSEKLLDKASRMCLECEEKNGERCNECLAACVLNEERIADAAPVRHGKWEVMANTKTRRICSCCGWDVPEYGKFYSYCPNCGADMRGAK